MGTDRPADAPAGLDKNARENADKCATYLTNKKAFLDYPNALRQGWPIATGIIEGACRTWHLAQEQRRVHRSRYLDGALPRAA